MSWVQFDGENRLILILESTTSFDAQDLYSEWKRWALNPDNLKYPQAMRSTGGDPLTETKYIAPYIEVLVDNGWRIKPWSGTYTLYVNGNLFGTGGQNPFTLPDSGVVTIIAETTGNALAVSADQTELSQKIDGLKNDLKKHDQKITAFLS